MNRKPTNILDYVGNTPLIELSKINSNKNVSIFAKLEGNNQTGSIKDRVARILVDDAERTGHLKPGDTIVEASTGNTALALALIAKQRGYRLKIVMLRKTTPGMSDLLSTYGVEIIWCDPSAGMKGAIQVAEEIGQEDNHCNTHQFESKANLLAHYENTAEEIIRDLPSVDMLITGIGTGGTLMGVGKRLKEYNPQLKVIGVEPKMGDQLQGLRSLEEGYIPPLLDMSLLDGRFIVDTQEAFQTARNLLDLEGVFAGVSSGAVLSCAMKMANRVDRGNILTIFADGGWKYLASGPWKEEMEERLIKPDETAWW